MSPTSPARNLLFLLALLFTVVDARAKVGDDLTALRHAYGSAKEVGGQMLFKHDGYSIAVYFDGTRSAMEIFVRDGSISTKPEITQPDIEEILALEGDGQSWNQIETHSGQPTWLRADAKLIARFNSGEKILAVMMNEK